jgi:hypothetical protein
MPVDPTAPLLAGVGTAAAGMGSFLGRNTFEMGGAVRDALLGRLGRPLPESRVLLGVEPVAALTVAGDRVEGRHGRWPAAHEGATAGPGPEGLPAPDGAGHATAALGWPAGPAPLALPLTWSEGAGRLPAALFDAVGADPAGGASLCFDRWRGPGPSGKQGWVVRGRGRAEREGDEVVVRLGVERVTGWDGVRVTTARPQGA